MAKDLWLTVNPMSGKGNATLSNSGTLHTGRLTRSTTVTASVIGLNAGKSYAVNQEPSLESIVFDKTSFNVSEDASTVTITGKSNSPKITFSLDTGNNIPITLPTTYTANEVETSNGSAIAGDPGAKAEFSFSIAISIPKNTVGQRVGKILAVGSDVEIKAQATITQATSSYTVSYVKGDYIDTINKTSEKVNYGGTATATATLPANTVQYAYTFDGWYDGSTKVGSDLALSVAGIISNRTFTAIGNRTLNRYTLVITVTPTGAGTTVGQGTYNYGSSVQATATPATGYNFTKWVLDTGDERTANPLTGIDINGNRTVQAVFTPKTYSISANAAYRVNESGDFTTGTTGGTVYGGGTYTHGDSVSLKATPATGYSFAGWYEGANQVSTAEAYTFTATSARTLVGRFQRNWYTITFSAGTGGTVSPTSARVQYGGSAESTATANTGYTFTQWSNGTKTAKLTVTNVTANATYAASFGINAYVITYQAGTGVASVTPMSETVNHGSNAAGSTATVATGYNFDGWYNGSTRVSTALKYGPTSVVKNMTLVAKGTIKTFAVTGTSQYRNTDSTGDWSTGTSGGSVSGSGTYDYGSKATLTASAATGYTFMGWFDTSGTSVETSTTYTINSVTAAVTVYARFQKNWYTVTYTRGTGVNSLSKTSERVAYNGTVTSETAVASTGYNSPTWTKSSGTGSLSVSAGKATLSAIQSNCTLVASATINSYTISYTKNANIASISKTSETVNYGGTATCTAALPANTAQYTYSFQGWYEGSDRVATTLALSVGSIASNRSFEARGTATVNRYTITVNNGSGGGTYNYGTEVTLTANTITGKTFSRWSDGVTTATRKVIVTGDATYTAEYTTNVYTVTYTKGTGIATISRTSESVSYGGNATGSTATVSTGYTFDGWYSGSTRVSTSLTYAPTNVTSNMSLEARATINRYTITPSAYYRNTDGTGNYTAGTTGGTVSGGGTVNYGGSATVTASAATGYQFDGWYSAGASGGTLLSSSASYTITGVSANQTVYARFTKRYFTITYQVGSYVTSVSRTSERVAYGANAAGSTMTINSTTAQYSYAIDGWYSGSTRVTSSGTYAPTSVTANATYQARATRTTRAYTVTYNKGSYIASVSRTSESVSYGSNAAGSTATVMANTAQYSYAFDGWYNGSTRVSTALTYAPTNITGALTLEARATRTTRRYTATIGVDSSCTGRCQVGSGSTVWTSSFSETVNYGDKINLQCKLLNSGDVFAGWYENGTLLSTNLTYPITVTSNRNIVAKVWFIDVSPTSLSYEASGGSKTVTVKSNIPSWSVS